MNTNFPKFEMIYGAIILFVIVVAVVAIFAMATLAGQQQLVIGLVAGLAPYFFLLYSEKQKEKKKHRAWLLRNEKAYVSAIADCFFVIEARLEDKSFNLGKVQSELKEKFEDIRAAMALWGNVTILRKWKSLQKNRDNLSAEQKNMRAEDLLLALRKEVGHDDSSLEPGELLLLLSKDEDTAK